MNQPDIVLPNRQVSSRTSTILLEAWPLLAVLAWSAFVNQMLPGPVAVLKSIPALWMQNGLGVELWTSVSLNLQAVAIFVLFSSGLAYATVLPLFRPVARLVAIGRFNGFVGLPLILTLWLGNPHYVKIALLVFGASVFAVPSIVHVIEAIPKAEYDHARTLKFSEWRVFYEVAIRGRLDEVIDILGANAAMIWMLVPMVEILFRSEGGVGAMATDMDRHMNLTAVYGIAIVVSVVGASQDFVIGHVKGILCPYAGIGLERR